MPTQDAILVPASLGIVKVAEDIGMPARFAPLLAILVAVVLSFLENPSLLAWNVTVLDGILAGLATFGLYAAGPAVGARVSARKPVPPTPAPTNT